MTRKLAVYALEIAAAMSDGTDADERIVDVCRLLVRFYQIMDSGSQFLTQAAREEIQPECTEPDSLDTTPLRPSCYDTKRAQVWGRHK